MTLYHLVGLFALPLIHPNQKRRSQTNGRISAHNHAGGEHYGKVFSGNRAEEDKGEQNQNNGQGSGNGADIRLLQRTTNDGLEIHSCPVAFNP